MNCSQFPPTKPSESYLSVNVNALKKKDKNDSFELQKQEFRGTCDEGIIQAPSSTDSEQNGSQEVF